jgi:hypothetical protein
MRKKTEKDENRKKLNNNWNKVEALAKTGGG